MEAATNHKQAYLVKIGQAYNPNKATCMPYYIATNHLIHFLTTDTTKLEIGINNAQFKVTNKMLVLSHMTEDTC